MKSILHEILHDFTTDHSLFCYLLRPIHVTIMGLGHICMTFAINQQASRGATCQSVSLCGDTHAPPSALLSLIHYLDCTDIVD